MSVLRNVPVIHGEKQIGLFQSMCFDQARKRVRAFVISSGMHGKRIVHAQHIRMIANEFILIDGWSRFRHTDKQQTALFVRDTSGRLAGCVTDYAIDETTLEVLAIEMISGYLPKESSTKDWIYQYRFVEDSDELCIPDILNNQQFDFREEFGVCGCPP